VIIRRRILFLSCLVLVLVFTIAGQGQTVTVNLHIVLVDQELNQKPVPWFHVTLRRTDKGFEVFDLKTRLDGTCRKAVPVGRYDLATPKPIDLQGRRYTW